MEPIAVKQVTDALIKEFAISYWQHCNIGEPGFMVVGYADDLVRSLRYALDQKTSYSEGCRWCIATENGTWPHIKVRYKVQDAWNGKPFDEQPFTFVIYANAISKKDWYPHVVKAVEQLVAVLAKDFPVVAEG